MEKAKLPMIKEHNSIIIPAMVNTWAVHKVTALSTDRNFCSKSLSNNPHPTPNDKNKNIKKRRCELKSKAQTN